MPDIQPIDYRKLLFDPENPRLPENLKGSPPNKLAEYYYEHSVISDLIKSMAENGFFPHEPMIVIPQQEGYFLVAEGNRRLTALCIIHARPEAESLPAPDEEFSEQQIARLKLVPCVVSTDVDAIMKFIGYRHISGPLTWEPEAKARFLIGQVERAVHSGQPNPFKFVADSVGSNVQTVRSSYIAMKLLWLARDEFGEDVSQIQNNRFGVWLRLMSSPQFRQFISFNDVRTYGEIQMALRSVDRSALKEVLQDLRANGDTRPVLRDSRDATNYGMVLMNSAARENLRQTGDLEAAITIIERESLPTRLASEARRIDALAMEVKSTRYDSEVELAAERLARAATNLYKLSKPDELDSMLNSR